MRRACVCVYMMYPSLNGGRYHLGRAVLHGIQFESVRLDKLIVSLDTSRCEKHPGNKKTHTPSINIIISSATSTSATCVYLWRQTIDDERNGALRPEMFHCVLNVRRTRVVMLWWGGGGAACELMCSTPQKHLVVSRPRDPTCGQLSRRTDDVLFGPGSAGRTQRVDYCFA